MRRIFQETKILIFNSFDGVNKPMNIIQTEIVGGVIVLEVVPRDLEHEDLTPIIYSTKASVNETESELLDKIEEFKNTTLNHDPFGDFDGWTLGKIMEDEGWDDWSKQVVKEMKNKFIKERVQFLRDNAKKRTN